MAALKYDYVIVGAGLTGATIARLLHDSGKRVIVYERRDTVGGNIHDYIHPSGIRVNSYGPHYFRTGSEKIWEFVNKYATWRPWAAKVKTRVSTGLECWPIQQAYIEAVAGKWQPHHQGNAKNFEEQCLSLMPEKIYNEFVKPYTELQWGKPCTELSADLITRFDIRKDGDERLKQDKYQALPVDGYTDFIKRLLADIPVELQYSEKSIPAGEKIIYTGPIDEFFNYQFGALQYRTQHREQVYFHNNDFYQPVVQVNRSGPTGCIRQIEWKHMMAEPEKASGTVITWEYPHEAWYPDEAEYPIPDAENKELYQQYANLAKAETPHILFCGRLGEYRYMDMDHAIGRGMIHAERLLNV